MVAKRVDEARSKMIESSQLYHEICNSLTKNGGVYAVDDYLTSITGIERIPTKYDSDTTCFAVRGGDRTRSVTFLLSASGALSPVHCSEHLVGAIGDKSYLNLIAGNLLSGCLAMREIQRRTNRVSPIDIYFILVGNQGRRNGYQRFSPQSLRESVLGSIGSRTHLIIVESTGLRACSVQKGSLIFRLTIRGRSHNPAFPWLGENAWDMLIRFEERLSSTMKPRHSIYPVEVGKAPPVTLSSFLIGYPTMTPLKVEYHQPYLFGEQSCIETEYYVCIPPEFLCKEFEEKLTVLVNEIARSSGCEATVSVVYEEEPFREDAQSVIIKATSSTFLKLTGFEPIFEWLPYPVSAKDLTSSGFAEDVVVLGPGDWTFSDAQEKR
jgi:hypothetical protein